MKCVPFVFKLEASGSLPFIQLGERGAGEDLVMGRPAPHHPQEARPIAAGHCPPTGTQKKGKTKKYPIHSRFLSTAQGGLA